MGCSWGGTRLVAHDLRTEPQTPRRTFENIIGMGWNFPEQVRLQVLSGCNRGAAVEADTIGEQQPKHTQSGSC